MPEALTDRQRAVYEAIVAHLRAHGHPPTLRVLGDAVGISSTNGVHDHLVALERKGWITRASDGESRGTRPVIVDVCETCGAPRFADPARDTEEEAA